MNIYVFHSRLFGTPRIITSNFPLNKEILENIVNVDNPQMPEQNRWKLQEISVYPKVSDFNFGS